jgi:hypothetical protein
MRDIDLFQPVFFQSYFFIRGSMSKFVGNTFSPMMLSKGITAEIREITLEETKVLVNGATSVISHETTAPVVSALLGQEVSFNRANVALNKGDELICVIPNFRANEAREFTFEEVSGAGFRCFHVKV